MNQPQIIRINAMNAARKAMQLVGAGGSHEFRTLMEMRRQGAGMLKHSNIKLAGYCERTLEHPCLIESDREAIEAALEYFREQIAA